jgi:RNA polymerase sigma-70 factor (ECF subfamily)
MRSAPTDPPPVALGAADLAAYGREVRRFLEVCGCDAATAADLCQEVLLRALRKDVALPTPAAARAWLRRSARLLLLEEGRQRRRRVAVAEPAWLDAVERHFERLAGEDEWVDALRECTQRLTPTARTALALVYRDGCQHAAAAARLGLRRDGLKTLLRRARAALRECITRRISWTRSNEQ